LISRRRFLEQTSLMAGSAVLAGSVLADVNAAIKDVPVPDPTVLDRAKTLLEKAPLVDTHNDLPSMLLETKAGDLTSFDMSKIQPDSLCGHSAVARRTRWSTALVSFR
jgi:hypothetical protein